MAKTKSKSITKRTADDDEVEKKPEISIQPPRKKPKPNKIPVIEIDTLLYEVEKILDQKLENGEILYKVKWTGYGDADNSLEPEFRLMCPEKLKKFVVTRFESRQSNQNITNILETCETVSDNKFLGTGNLLAVIGKQFISRGAVNYIEHSSLAGNRRFLKAMHRHENDWYLYSITHSEQSEHDSNMKRYTKELVDRFHNGLNYPHVKVLYPHGFKSSLYTPPPPPHFNITLTTMDGNKASNLFRSTNKGFGGVLPFVHRDHFQESQSRAIENSPRWEFLKSPVKTDIKRRPKYHANLSMRFSSELGWALCVDQSIDAGKPLIQMMGKIVDESVAHMSLIEDGFPIAVSSIFKIGLSDKVLDQRQVYDFSRFILHSCEPNCAVRLELPPDNVKQEGDESLLVVYSNENLRSYGEELSLDYFKCYEEDVESFFDNLQDPLLDQENGRLAYLNENKINFIYCNCGQSSCREILYIDEMMIGHKECDRFDTLNNMPFEKRFKGTRLDPPL